MIKDLETAIGYQFHNISLLQNALTHSSYANERWHNSLLSNERLEFLGDSILGMLVAEYLYRNFPDRPEGDLTRMRAALVCEESLYEVAQSLGLGNELRLGKGEEAGGGRCRPSILADATESVFAAVYLDGGMEAARNFILPFITEGKTAEEDYKTQLQEVVQQDPSAVLRYEVTGETGPDHNKQFTVCVWRNGRLLAEGKGRSKKAAEQHAAKVALEKLQ